jgi:ADP-ribose pyrophosphatase
MAKRIYKKNSLTLEEKTIKMPHGGLMKDFPVVTHDDGVIVVPILEIGGIKHAMLIEQWRAAMNLRVIEVPGGGQTAGEPLQETAAREVREESGLEVYKLVKLGEVLPAPGWDIEKQSHFIAECELVPEGALQVGDQELDRTENIIRKLVPLKKVREMLKKREIKDLKTRAILYDTLEYYNLF